MPDKIPSLKKKIPKGAATRVFLRGLSISLPPILTIVILLWVGQVLYTSIIQPIGNGVRWTIASAVNEIRQEKDLLPSHGLPPLPQWRNRYRVTPQLQNDIPEIEKQIATKVQSAPRMRAPTARRSPRNSCGPSTPTTCSSRWGVGMFLWTSFCPFTTFCFDALR